MCFFLWLLVMSWDVLWWVLLCFIRDSCLLLKRNTLSKSLKTRWMVIFVKGTSHHESSEISQIPGTYPTQLPTHRNVFWGPVVMAWRCRSWRSWTSVMPWYGWLPSKKWWRSTGVWRREVQVLQGVWNEICLSVCLFVCLFVFFVCLFVCFLFGGCNNLWWLLIYTLEMDGFWWISMGCGG